MDDSAGSPSDLSAREMVLVADDDEELRAHVVAALLEVGYGVLEAGDGVEALAIVAETESDPRMRPDVIVIDVRMPRLSGFGVLQELRRAHVDLPVLLMSGFHPASVAVVAMRLGVVDILKKPFTSGELQDAVKRAIGWRKKRLLARAFELGDQDTERAPTEPES